MGVLDYPAAAVRQTVLGTCGNPFAPWTKWKAMVWSRSSSQGAPFIRKLQPRKLASKHRGFHDRPCIVSKRSRGRKRSRCERNLTPSITPPHTCQMNLCIGFLCSGPPRASIVRKSPHGSLNDILLTRNGHPTVASRSPRDRPNTIPNDRPAIVSRPVCLLATHA